MGPTLDEAYRAWHLRQRRQVTVRTLARVRQTRHVVRSRSGIAHADLRAVGSLGYRGSGTKASVERLRQRGSIQRMGFASGSRPLRQRALRTEARRVCWTVVSASAVLDVATTSHACDSAEFELVAALQRRNGARCSLTRIRAIVPGIPRPFQSSRRQRARRHRRVTRSCV